MAYLKLTIEELLNVVNGFNHTELHVHHTWKPDHSNFNGKNHTAIQDGMRNFHVNTNKWDDIAQHGTLFPDGYFLTGRDFAKQPISIKGFNGADGKYPFAVEMVGNFDIGQDKLEGKQKQSILMLAKFFDDQKKYVRFHRENAPKTCPGSGIDKEVFMKEVKALGEVKAAEKPVSPFAKEAHEWATEYKISDGSRPHDNITRQEQLVITKRAHDFTMSEVKKLLAQK